MTSDRRRARRRRASYVRRALAGFARSLASEFSGSHPSQSGPLSRLDPRAKIAGIVVLIVGATLVHGLIPLGLLFGVAMVLAASGGIGVRRLARVWLGVPLFSAAIILPAITNFVTDGRTIVTLWHFGAGARLGPWPLPDALTITDAGLLVAARFLLRIVDCVSLAFILVATTGPGALVNGLRRLGTPKTFGMVLSMSQRYLALLVRAAEEIHLAKLSRTISLGSVRREQRWVASGMGSLFRRTHRLAQEVHDAMISRGYDGDLRPRAAPGLRYADGVWLIASVAVAAALIVSDRLI